MYSRPLSHSPSTLRRTATFLLRFPSSTKASGQTLVISSSFSTRCPAFATSTNSNSGILGVSGTGLPSRTKTRSRDPSEKDQTHRSGLPARSYGGCRTFGRIFPDFGKDFQTATELGFASSGIECAAWNPPSAKILSRGIKTNDCFVRSDRSCTYFPLPQVKGGCAFEQTKGTSEPQPKKLRPAKQRRKTLDP